MTWRTELEPGVKCNKFFFDAADKNETKLPRVARPLFKWPLCLLWYHRNICFPVSIAGYCVIL